MTALIRKWDVAGAGLAVARKDKLLLVHGYGLANMERQVPVEPTSLFRLASLSKTECPIGGIARAWLTATPAPPSR
jgi:CubicO group peptidase (beta-lactamase class C family)